MTAPQDWKPAFNLELAQALMKAYKLQPYDLATVQGDGAVRIDFVNARDEDRWLLLNSDYAAIFDQRSVVLERNTGSDWIRALTDTLSNAYPPTLQ